jgi:hypothetical protein
MASCGWCASGSLRGILDGGIEAGINAAVSPLSEE